MKPVKKIIFALTMSFMTSSVWAIGNIDVSDLADQATVDAFTEDLGAALSYKAISPAEPLGLLGFDIGLEITGTSLSSIDKWGKAIGNDDLALLPLPKLHVHKGLPFGIDLGAVYASVPGSDIAYAGGELRYSFVSGNIAIPAIAIRGTYTTLLGIDDAEFSTKGVELTISKGFLLLTPYAGIGQVWANAKVDTEEPNTALPITIESDVSMTKWFVGLNVNLGLMNFAFETDQTGDSQSYSAKVGLRF